MSWHLRWTCGVWSIFVCLNSLLDSEYKIQCQRCINCNYLENNDLEIKYLIVQQFYTPKCYQCHGFTVGMVHICSLRWFCLLTVHTTKPKTQYGSLRSQGLCSTMRLLGYSVSVVISVYRYHRKLILTTVTWVSRKWWPQIKQNALWCRSACQHLHQTSQAHWLWTRCDVFL